MHACHNVHLFFHSRHSEVTTAKTRATLVETEDEEAIFIDDDDQPKRRNTLATMKVKLSREKPCVQIELLTVNGNCSRRHQ